MQFRPTFVRYLAGLACTFAGAWLTGVTGSLIPLALGASASVMCTTSVVRRICQRATRTQ
jgi:hypothetical protein